MKEVLKVSSQSDVKKVAGAIAEMVREGKEVEIQVIGAATINKAVKAIIIARNFTSSNGFNLATIPAFTEVEINGETRTAVKFIIRNL
jgi:stage V sporulation protein S